MKRMGNQPLELFHFDCQFPEGSLTFEVNRGNPHPLTWVEKRMAPWEVKQHRQKGVSFLQNSVFWCSIKTLQKRHAQNTQAEGTTRFAQDGHELIAAASSQCQATTRSQALGQSTNAESRGVIQMATKEKNKRGGGSRKIGKVIPLWFPSGKTKMVGCLEPGLTQNCRRNACPKQVSGLGEKLACCSLLICFLCACLEIKGSRRLLASVPDSGRCSGFSRKQLQPGNCSVLLKANTALGLDLF